MKAYCINLDSRPDRLAHMVEEFARAGIPFDRIAAVDARQSAVAAAAAEIPVSSFQGARISVGAYACLQSHRRAWKGMLDEGQAYGAFFEDDVLLVPDFPFLKDDAWIPADAEIIKLETFLSRTHVARRRTALGEGWELGRLLSTHIGAAAYILRADAAERLLAATEHSGNPVDMILFSDHLSFFRSAMTYQMLPALAVQGDRLGLRKGKMDSGWQATSIQDRHAAGQNIRRKAGEGTAARVLRRFRGEVRALFYGSKYMVVPHGARERAGSKSR